jgi:hypothetical protein
VRDKLLSNHETRTIIEEAFSMLYQESFVQSLKVRGILNHDFTVSPSFFNICSQIIITAYE